MKKTNKKEQVFERFGMIASKLGNQIHMRTFTRCICNIHAIYDVSWIRDFD